MKDYKAALIGAFLALLLVLAAGKFCGLDRQVGNFYWDIKSEIFGGLFTISGLLLSVKTYIILKLKEGIYCRESYLRMFARARLDKSINDQSHLEPLERLSKALANAVAFSAVAAVCQLGAAAIGGFPGALLGFSCAGAAAGSLIYCWMNIRTNLNNYFEFIKLESMPEMQRIEKEMKAEMANPKGYEDFVEEKTVPATSADEPNPS